MQCIVPCFARAAAGVFVGGAAECLLQSVPAGVLLKSMCKHRPRLMLCASVHISGRDGRYHVKIPFHVLLHQYSVYSQAFSTSVQLWEGVKAGQSCSARSAPGCFQCAGVPSHPHVLDSWLGGGFVLMCEHDLFRLVWPCSQLSPQSPPPHVSLIACPSRGVVLTARCRQIALPGRPPFPHHWGFVVACGLVQTCPGNDFGIVDRCILCGWVYVCACTGRLPPKKAPVRKVRAEMKDKHALPP